MLTESSLLQNIELDLGYKYTDLEITHEEIMNIIKLRTLPDFSKYYPYQERIRINSKEDIVEGYVNRYYLKTDNEIMNINRVIGNARSGFGDIVVGTPNPTSGYGIGGSLIEGDAFATLQGFTNPNTYQYIHPGMIEFTPNFNNADYYLVVCNVVHPSNLTTIPSNMQDHFRTLATLDVKSSLYLIRNRFANLQNNFGSIELFVDELSSARDERKEFIEFLSNNTIKTAHRKKLFIG